MSEFLLSIAIPTYNRAIFLDRCLHYLYLQNDDILNNVEIIVSDNASTDNTGDVVNNFIDAGLKIRYFRNFENRGADFNIAQCYKVATGRYVLALGDDDLILLSGIKKLTNLLSTTSECGIVYLSSYPLRSMEVPHFNNTVVNYTVYNNYKDFILKISYYITFISGNIINRKYVEEVDLDKYFGTNLSPVPLILSALLNSSQNIFVGNGILAAQIENSSGYNYLKVFGVNFPTIVNEQQSKYPNKYFSGLLSSDLILTFIPYAILLLRTTNHQFEVDWQIRHTLKYMHKKNWYYLLVHPFFYLPVSILKFYRLVLSAFSKLNKFFIIRDRNRIYKHLVQDTIAE